MDLCPNAIIAGGRFQLLRDYGEINVADPDTLASFLDRGLTLYPKVGWQPHIAAACQAELT
jgi:hypothetical protein